MSLTKRQREQLLKRHCVVINDDDAIDPRHYFYNKRKPKSKMRKALQLCRQVAETLHMVLTDGQPELDGLQVIDVIPAPDSRRMLVIVGVDEARKIESASEVDAMMNTLQNQIPRLRSEIARSIHRRKTPQLIFEFAKLKPKNLKGVELWDIWLLK